MKSSVQLQEIKAAVVRQKGGPFELETLQLDGPRASEVLVRIVATGICATDIHAREEHLPMPLPAVLGHEGAGVVERGWAPSPPKCSRRSAPQGSSERPNQAARFHLSRSRSC